MTLLTHTSSIQLYTTCTAGGVGGGVAHNHYIWYRVSESLFNIRYAILIKQSTKIINLINAHTLCLGDSPKTSRPVTFYTNSII